MQDDIQRAQLEIHISSFSITFAVVKILTRSLNNCTLATAIDIKINIDI